jgi:transposase InsO family protein
VTIAGKEVSLPWKETSPVELRKQLIDEYLKHESSLAELCRRFGVSRKTGYKWVGRFLEGCELVDRSRRPHRSPAAVASWVEDAIVTARRQRPRWGPRKLRGALLRANPDAELPSVSTFALIFKRNGLVTPRRRRNRTPPSSVPLAHATGPNALWCIDFKGDFTVGRIRCYPLTITDAYSRYLIACVALPSTKGGPVRRVLEQVFAGFGLPDAIRSDNGSPFASTGPCGLSELSAWWIRLGIRHERIEPGKPQQNGRHERMHLTLKQEATKPPQATLRAQQRVFDLFRRDYNEVRPHEALGNKVPADFYERSGRVLPEPAWGRDFEYPEHFERVRTNKTGAFLWNGRSVFVSAALRHEPLGLEWRRGVWRVHFGPMRIGKVVRKNRRVRFIRDADRPQPEA